MILLCGMTCSGKNTIRDECIKRGFEPIVTYTTRPMRKGEVNGETYHFIPKWKFLLLKKLGFFAETTHYDVATGERWYYGTSKKSLKNDKGILIVNPDGIESIKRICPNAFVVYLTVPISILKERLEQRGDNPDEATRRLKADEHDFEDIYDLTDYIIENDGLVSAENVTKNILNNYKAFQQELLLKYLKHI